MDSTVRPPESVRADALGVQLAAAAVSLGKRVAADVTNIDHIHTVMSSSGQIGVQGVSVEPIFGGVGGDRAGIAPGYAEEFGWGDNASPKTLGAFVGASRFRGESDPAEVVRCFVRWIAGHWEELEALFPNVPNAVDVRPELVEDNLLGSAISGKQLVMWLRGKGFSLPDALTVYTEMQRECLGLEVEESFEDIVAVLQGVTPAVSFVQLQSFKFRGVTALAQLLRQRRGTVLRAWRLDLDMRGTGVVAKEEFERACTPLGCRSDAEGIARSSSTD